MEIRDSKGLTEAEYLEQYAKKNYPKPSLTADIAVFTKEEGQYRVLMVKRGNHPCIGRWALPGGFANANECIEDTAARELVEETGVTGLDMLPVGLYSKPGRDPRGWVVSQLYCAMVDRKKLTVHAGDDAADAAWFRVSAEDGTLVVQDGAGTQIEPAFDHAEMLLAALNMLEGRN